MITIIITILSLSHWSRPDNRSSCKVGSSNYDGSCNQKVIILDYFRLLSNFSNSNEVDHNIVEFPDIE